MSASPFILVAEDEKLFQRLLVNVLSDEGYAIHAVTHGYEVLKVLESRNVDLLLLDLNLPDENGLVLIRQIRARSGPPIVVLTGNVDETIEVACLEEGADDFLGKSVSPEVLRLRIRNALRHAAADNARSTAAANREILSLKGHTVDLQRQRVFDRDGRDLELTPFEFRTLRVLINARGRVLTRGQILDSLSTGPDGPAERMIDGFVSRIRKKMSAPDIIRTVKGEGYRLDATPGVTDDRSAIKPTVAVNGLPFVWGPDIGKLTAGGAPAAVLPIESALAAVLGAMARELGPAFYRMLVARAIEKNADFQLGTLIPTATGSLENSFRQWADAMAALGWGRITLVRLDTKKRFARVRVTDPWELRVEQSSAVRAGCPWLIGKLRALFYWLLSTQCDVTETAISYDPNNLFVDLDITATEADLDQEIEDFRVRQSETLESMVLETAADNKRQLGEALEALSAAQAETERIRIAGIGSAERTVLLQAQLRALLGNLDVACYIKDADGRYLWANDAFKDMFHLDALELNGMVPYDIHPFDIARNVRNHDLEIIRTGEPAEIDHTLTGPDGEKTYTVSKFPIKDAGRTLGIGAFVTERVNS